MLVLLALVFSFLIPGVFVFNWAMEAYVRAMALLSCVTLASLVGASFASVARGRTDIRAAHRALSATFWGIVWLAIPLFWLYSRWILSAGPTDITAVNEAEAAPAGDWIAVSGKTWGRFDYAPTFLWDPGSNHFLRTGPKFGAPAFSRDGNRVAWFRWQNMWRPDRITLELVAVELDLPERKLYSSGIVFKVEKSDPVALPDRCLFSPNATLVAELHNAILSVYDISSGKALASANIPAANSSRFSFIREDRLRIYASEGIGEAGDAQDEIALNVYEFDISNKKLDRLSRIQPLTRPLPVLADSSGDRLLIRDGGTTKKLSLYEAKTGRAIRTVGVVISPDVVQGDFLSDGRIVVGEVRSGVARLHLCSPDGLEIRAVELAPAKSFFFGAEPAPGHLVVGLGPEAGGARHNMNATIMLVDVTTGESRRVGQGLYPTTTFPRLLSVDPIYLPSPGSLATKLFYGPHGSLINLDPSTGQRRVTLGGQ